MNQTNDINQNINKVDQNRNKNSLRKNDQANLAAYYQSQQQANNQVNAAQLANYYQNQENQIKNNNKVPQNPQYYPQPRNLSLMNNTDKIPYNLFQNPNKIFLPNPRNLRLRKNKRKSKRKTIIRRYLEGDQSNTYVRGHKNYDKNIRNLQRSMVSGDKDYLTPIGETRGAHYIQKRFAGYERSEMRPKRKAYSSPVQVDMASALAKPFDGASIKIGGKEVTGGSLSVKFPDSPPLIMMTQQPFYSYI